MKKRKHGDTSSRTSKYMHKQGAQSQATTAYNLLDGLHRNLGTHNKQPSNKIHSSQEPHAALNSVAGWPTGHSEIPNST
jgi:hypothetical protein